MEEVEEAETATDETEEEVVEYIEAESPAEESSSEDQVEPEVSEA